MSGSVLGLGRVLVIAAGCSVLLCGCRRPPAQVMASGPQGAGVLRRIEASEADAERFWGEEDATAGPIGAELAQRVKSITAHCDQSAVQYSPDATRALVYPPTTGSGPTELWLASAAAEHCVTVETPPGVELAALWAPDARCVAVFPGTEAGFGGFLPQALPADDQERRLALTCLSWEEDEEPTVRAAVGPRDSGSWLVGPFSADGKLLFGMSNDEPGELWTIAVSDCEFSRLYTQPPIRWPPRWERKIQREGPAATPMYAKAFPWGTLLPSPSGRFLLFDSYPPDNYFAQALWVADVQTRKCRQVTWESAEKYWHAPLAWGDDERSFNFGPLSGADTFEYYELTLDAHLWEEEPSTEGD